MFYYHHLANFPLCIDHRDAIKCLCTLDLYFMKHASQCLKVLQKMHVCIILFYMLYISLPFSIKHGLVHYIEEEKVIPMLA